MSKTFAAMPTYAAYKDSGVEWKSFPLCAVTSPKSLKNNQNLELLSVYLNLGVIRFSEVNEKRTNATSEDLSNYQEVAVGDFVLNNQQAWRGSVGVSKYNGIVSPAYLVLSLSPLIDVGFANYYFRDGAMVSQYLICSKGVGTIQRNLYWQQLKRSVVTIPPLPEQKAIADFLDKKTSLIDEAISVKAQQIELLKERKQILIQNAVTQGLNPDAPKRDSGVEWIGDIPAHWKVKRLKYLAKIHNGLDYKKVHAETGYPVIGSGGQFTYANSYLHDGEAVLLGRKGTINKPLYINERFWTVDTMFYAICNRLAKTKFVYFSAKIIPFGYYSTSTALPSMTQFDLLNHPFFIPPMSEQTAIVAHIETQSSKIDQAIALNQQQIEKLKEYKTTLINSAVTGKIKVVDSSEGE
ncbi:MAG: restriction endonuclease subunit S, partial [Ghiorsea sp.]|nr:restriction endonuclease subunit S [Ghiorsea sp.]